MSKLKTSAKIVLISTVVAAATFFAVRAFDIRHMPPLQLWHTHVPHEPGIKTMDAGNWAGYLKAEEVIFNEVRTQVSDKLPAEARTPLNRYYAGSLISIVITQVASFTRGATTRTGIVPTSSNPPASRSARSSCYMA